MGFLLRLRAYLRLVQDAVDCSRSLPPRLLCATDLLRLMLAIMNQPNVQAMEFSRHRDAQSSRPKKRVVHQPQEGVTGHQHDYSQHSGPSSRSGELPKNRDPAPIREYEAAIAERFRRLANGLRVKPRALERAQKRTHVPITKRCSCKFPSSIRRFRAVSRLLAPAILASNGGIAGSLLLFYFLPSFPVELFWF
jgi:hypothetical protein